MTLPGQSGAELQPQYAAAAEHRLAGCPPALAINLAHDYACAHYGSVESAKSKFDGFCVEFVGELVDSTPGARLAYFETPLNYRWRYHAAMELGGLIHDLWGWRPSPLETYLPIIGAYEVEYPAERFI